MCGPVREAIRRNYEKSQQMIQMSKLSSSSSNPTEDNGEQPRQTKKIKTEGGARPGSKAGARKKPDGDEAVEIGEDGKPVKAPRKKPPPKKTLAEGEGEGGGKLKITLPPRPAALAPPAPVVPKTNQLDPISCSVYGFSNLHIEAHLKNIHEGMRMTAAEIKAVCLPIVDGLLKHQDGYIFATPVDPVAYNLPDYFQIVKVPMDLGTVKKKLETSQYRDPVQVASDVQLVFDNAILYNPKENNIHKVAVALKRASDNQFKQSIAMHEKKIDEMKKQTDSCSLCGEQNVKFEPPVYYCQGKCGGLRIRRNAFYYSTQNNQNHWCSPCFVDMKESQPIVLPDMTIYKSDLAASKKKHVEVTLTRSRVYFYPGTVTI